MPFPSQLIEILDSIGCAATEVTASFDTLRAYVGIWRFNPQNIPGGCERYAYLGETDVLYVLRRFEVNRELIEQDLDVHPDQLLTSQEIAVADLRLAEEILMTWLPSLDMLKEPKHCDIPI
jgi:hypothetical protein